MTKTNLTLPVEGMSCGSCVAHVEKALQGVPGVSKVEVDLDKKQASVTLAEEVDRSSLIGAIEEAGYQVPAA